MKRGFLPGAVLFFSLLPGLNHAQSYSVNGPISLRTQNSVLLQTVNLNPAKAKVLNPGVLELRVESAFSNLYERESDAVDSIFLDMEMTRVAVQVHYGLGPDLEVGIEIPFIRFDGGFLDGFIQDFHNFFSLPNGGRDRTANGFFTYRVQSGAIDYNVAKQGMAAGDLTLLAKHQILEEGRKVPGLSSRFAFKFPSGEPDKGVGSGNPGFGLGVALEKSLRRFHGFLNLNYLVDGANDTLERLMIHSSFDFSIAGEYSISRRISAILQINGGSSRLKGTGLETWDGVPLDLIVGVAGEFPALEKGRSFFWQVAFSEDVRAVGPSVDFTVFTSLGIRFPLKKWQSYRGDFFAYHPLPLWERVGVRGK